MLRSYVKIMYCMVANKVLHLFYPNKHSGFHWSFSTSCFCYLAMLIGKEFCVKLTWKHVMLILAGRKKKVIKVNRKLHMLPRRKCWKEKPKSKAPWDNQVWFFVILKMQRIVLILYIYLLDRRKSMRLFYPHFWMGTFYQFWR